MDPGPIFFTVKSTATKALFTFLQFTFLVIYFSATILHPHDTFNPLCSAKPVSLTTSLNSWDKVICWLLHLRKRRLSPTGRLNLGFITKGKLAAVLITPSLLGFPTVQPTSTQCQQECLAPLHTSRISGVLEILS